MGFKITIDGRTYETTNFNVQEAATPLAAGDSSGQVGTISFGIAHPDPEVAPNHPINRFGVNYLVDKAVRLDDTRKGFTIGKVASASRNANGLIEVEALSRLDELNTYNTQAQPFVGTLENAFKAYLQLAGVNTALFVDPAVSTKAVVFPGWYGELWYNLKQLAIAVDCDVSLVSGIIILRPIRTRTATRGRDLDRSTTVGGGSLAQYIEVYQYNNTPITNKLVYPIGGWNADVPVITVNEGESIEEVLELSASVSSIVQPTMMTFVDEYHTSSSVFTAVGDDGLPVQPAQWVAQGGDLRLTINDDTTSLTAHITAPTGMVNGEGEPIKTFGIALSSDTGTGRYSTLRVVGTGVAFDKQVVRFPTGIGPQETGTEVGVTIDNPFLSTKTDVYTAALRAVRAYNGSALSISGTVSAINQLGDSGNMVVTTYAEEKLSHGAGATFASVQAAYAGKTYQQIVTELNEDKDSLYQNQVFGNAAGARIWDETSARWYRIRSATMTPGTIQFEAEDDLTFGDMQQLLGGETYASVQAKYNGLTYREVDLLGMK